LGRPGDGPQFEPTRHRAAKVSSNFVRMANKITLTAKALKSVSGQSMGREGTPNFANPVIPNLIKKSARDETHAGAFQPVFGPFFASD
jgi:hypothetical protein